MLLQYLFDILFLLVNCFHAFVQICSFTLADVNKFTSGVRFCKKYLVAEAQVSAHKCSEQQQMPSQFSSVAIVWQIASQQLENMLMKQLDIKRKFRYKGSSWAAKHMSVTFKNQSSLTVACFKLDSPFCWHRFRATFLLKIHLLSSPVIFASNVWNFTVYWVISGAFWWKNIKKTSGMPCRNSVMATGIHQTFNTTALLWNWGLPNCIHHCKRFPLLLQLA